jgi:hypothetical protein
MTCSCYDDHLDKLKIILDWLRKAGLKVNAEKSTFCTKEIEYLGYWVTRKGIKPLPNKIEAIMELEPPKNVKGLRSFLGIIQYYRDLWKKRSHILAPLTDLVGECGHNKNSKKNKRKFIWEAKHQQPFDEAKKLVCRDVMLAYLDFTKEFLIYTDASRRHLGSVIVQNNRPLAFFSRKLTNAQMNYTVTELELLSIVETLKEFRTILLGQKIKVFTDHKNLVYDSKEMISQRALRWRILLEEFGPQIEYIKGDDNSVADALSRLDRKGTDEKAEPTVDYILALFE